MELYTKDKEGNLKKLGNVKDDQLKNITTDGEDISTFVKNYWTSEKCGKHKDLASKHESILAKDLKVPAKDFFEQVSQNHFVFQNFGPYSLNDFLKKARLDRFVKPEYLEDCLKVTTPRPTIGKGEFLLAANFSNINFSKESGDLMDSSGNRIEVKGKHSYLGGNEKFRELNDSQMFAIFNIFSVKPEGKDLTIDSIEKLQKLLLQNKEQTKKVMMLLQNLRNPSESLANQMVELFNQSEDLKTTIAASHLFAYMRLQKANFLFALNDNTFSGFAAPKNLKEAFEIMRKFNINAWMIGNSGISITVKN